MRFFIKLLMKILDKGINQEITPTFDGKIILKMNKLYEVIGILSLIVSIFVIILGFISGSIFSSDFIYVLTFFLLLSLPGILLILYSQNIMIEVNSEKILYIGITKKIKEIKWDELKTISFNSSSKEIILKSNNITIRLNLHLKGFGSLIKIIKENVDVSIYKKAFEKIGII